MMKNIFNIRIPSLFGIILLLVGVGATSYLVDRGIIFEGRAAPEKEPINIAITNVSPTSFTVMYTTDDILPGSLTYGTEKKGSKVTLDDRDKETGRATAYRIHHLTVQNLTPSTTYYFTILSGDALFQNNGEPYSVKTAPKLSEAPKESPPILGTVKFPEGAPAQETLVLLKSDTIQPLSALVAKDGTYSLKLTDLRSKDLDSRETVQDTDLFDLLVLSPESVSDVKVTAQNSHPVPLILFGQAYDFTISNDPLATESQTASESATTPFPDTDTEGTEKVVIGIVSPEAEEKFSDQQPLFSGTALPGETVDVIIHSDTPITDKVTADSSGSWTYRPKTPLAPGIHTFTIKTKDVTGTVRELTKSFTVSAQGSQFIEPSVSPAYTPTPTVSFATPTPIPTINEPTVTASPTAALATPTLAPTTAAISTTPLPTRTPIAATGTEDVFIGALVGVGTMIAGILLFFFMKGSTL